MTCTIDSIRIVRLALCGGLVTDSVFLFDGVEVKVKLLNIGLVVVGGMPGRY